MLLKICRGIRKLITVIIKIKLTLQPPPQKKIVLYDEHAYYKSLKILPNNNFHILKTRVDEINIFIFLKILINLKFSYLAYLECYIKYVNPKLLITFVDNDFNFYKLNFKNIIKIAVQNGRRLDPQSFLSQKNYKKKFITDYIFTFNDKDRKIYEDFGGIKSKKFISHGSYRLNSTLEIKSTVKKFDLIYISTYRNFYNDKHQNVYNNISSNEYVRNEIKLLKIILEYSIKYNKKISILMRFSENHKTSMKEKNFYNKHLSSTKELNFVFSKKNEQVGDIKSKSKILLSPYANLNLANVVIGIDSTLLYEALTAGHKVAFFSVRGKKNSMKYRIFGWPYKISNTGFFWTSRLHKKNIYKTLNNLFNISNYNWKNYVQKYSYIMKKDSGNKQLKELIRSIIQK